MPDISGVVFVCGTDTGVGKTVVSALLLALMRESGLNAAPMKPVETGCRSRRGAPFAADLDLSLKTAGMRPPPEELELMSPYRFKKPASPHLAAAREGRRIRNSVIHAALDRLRQRYRPVLVEGAGGLMVPLHGSCLTLDLLAELRVPILLVARSGLGAINHTLLTLNVLAQRQLKVAGVIFNDGPQEDPLIVADNLRCIPRLSGVRCLGRIRFHNDIKNLLAGAARNPEVLEKLVPGRRQWIRKVLRHVS